MDAIREGYPGCHSGINAEFPHSANAMPAAALMPSETRCNEGVPRTDEALAGILEMSVDTLNDFKRARSYSNELICSVSSSQLQRSIDKFTNPPRPDSPQEWAEFRALQQRDESGTVKPDGLIHGIAQRKYIVSLVQPTAGISQTGWTALGPGNIGGRVRAAAVHPANSQIIFIGSVSGGIWKTTDGGANWAPVNDFMGNLSVSSIVFDPTDTTNNTLYAGTGEGFFNSDAVRGAGVFKSSDGGVTWAQLSSTSGSAWYYVNRLAINNNGVLLAAVGQGSQGIYLSSDHGNTWTLKQIGYYMDVLFDPNDPAKAVAGGGYFSGGLVAYSNDTGATWATTTIPGGGRVELAYAKANANVVYASVDVNSGKIFKSTDGGATWAAYITPAHLGNQGWYDNTIWVDPTDSAHLLVGGLDIYRITGSPPVATKISTWYYSPSSPHADHHIIFSDPGYNGTTNRRVYFGNDGGVQKAEDINNANSASTNNGWTNLNNGLAITQFYSGAGKASVGGGRFIGGTQDNGSLMTTGSTNWTTFFGGDGGYSAVDPADGNYLYGEYIYLQLHRNTTGGAGQSSFIDSGITDAGSSANFIAPFILDPNNANRMLAGGQSLWLSSNVKATTPTWSKLANRSNAGYDYISAIAVAEGDSTKIWYGTNYGTLAYSNDGTNFTTLSLGTPGRMVLRILIDKTNPYLVYVSYGGYSVDNLYKLTSADSGATWTKANITGNLPSTPIRGLARHPTNANWFYAGTEVGIFDSTDGGNNWFTVNDGPANVSVDELFWYDNSTLVAATHGRGMFKRSVITGPTTTASPAGGTYNSTQSVTLTCSDGTGSGCDKIYYTTDGTTPTAASTVYTTPINISVTTTLKFFATDLAGNSETVKSEAYTIDTIAPTGTISIDSGGVGNFSDNAESGMGNWTAGPPWGTTTSSYHSATTSFTDSPSGSYNNNVNTSLTLANPINLSNAVNPVLTFWHKYSTELRYDYGYVEISTNGGSTWTQLAVYNGTLSTWTQVSISLSRYVGQSSVLIRFRFYTDFSIVYDGWYIDDIAVSGISTLIPNPSYTSTTSVTLTLSCTDTNGCAQMQFSNDNATWSTAETFATSKAWTLTTGDGIKTVYVTFRDSAGNWSTSTISDTIVLDTTAPTTAASPAGGIYNSTQNVTLTCSDSTGSGCDKIYYTTDGTTPTTGSAIYSSPIIISATTTLKFFAKDIAGNSEAVKSEAYTIDTNATIGTISINSGAASTNSAATTLTLSCTATNGCAQMQFSNDNASWSTAETYATSKEWTLTTGDGIKTVYVKFRDSAGNGSTSTISDTIVLDTTAPATTASPAGGIYNSTQSVTLTCNDGTGSGCDKIYYTTDGTIPGTSSTIYSGAISISATTTLKFFAVDNTGNNEVVKTETYDILYTLNVSKVGAGSGTVTSTPPGIDCGAYCTASFINGDVVSLTAIPSGNSLFAGWSGDCSGTVLSTSVTMDSGKTCTATFIVGLIGEYYNNSDLTDPGLVRTDPVIDFDWGTGSPDTAIDADTFAVRWTGKLQVDYNETYTFYAITDDGIRLWIDGHLVQDYWQIGGVTIISTMDLMAGIHDIKVEFFEDTGAALAQLYWSSPSTPYGIIPNDHLYPPDSSGASPVLEWAGDTGFAVDGVEPETGDTTTMFTYRVKYTDADGNPPMSGFPRAHILKGGAEITGSPFVMSYESGDYAGGAIYSFSTNLTTGADYTYYFDAVDSTGLQAVAVPVIPTPTAPVDAPDVADHSILGAVTINGTGLGGVTMTLSGCASAATGTATDGTYSFTGLADGDCTVTPSLNGYAFIPPSRSVTVAGADMTGIDFTAGLLDSDNDGYSDIDEIAAGSDPYNAASTPEVCDGIDNDLDGLIDEGLLTTYYRDADGDTYGSTSLTIQACTQPPGYVSNSTDCNDNNASIKPGATEVCNGVDDNCNGQIDEGVKNTYYRDADGDSYGSASVTTQACTQPSGYASNSSDCNDGNASIKPGATETGNGVDDNCNGQVDEGIASKATAPDITVNPVTLPFGSVNVDSSSERAVSVRNDGDASLTITAITNPSSSFSKLSDGCSGQTLSPSAGCTITIRFSPVSAGTFNSSFDVQSNDPDENPVTVSLTGTGASVASPDIDVSSVDLSFPNISAGVTADQEITINNKGNSPLTILGSMAPSDPFSIIAGEDNCSNHTLAPNQSCKIKVRFTPTGPGTFNSSFNILSNDPDEDPVTVNLSGSATPNNNNMPTKPNLAEPANGTGAITTTYTLKWERSTDTDGDPVTYRLYIGPDAGFAGVDPIIVSSTLNKNNSAKAVGYSIGLVGLLGIITFGGLAKGKRRIGLFIMIVIFAGGLLLTSCGSGKSSNNSGNNKDYETYTVTNLKPNTTYYWKVVADDGKGGMTESDKCSFTTGG